MGLTLLRNALVFDGEHAEPADGRDILFDDDVIREVSDARITARSAEVIDLEGAFVMPGLIDAHVHVTDWGASPAELTHQPASYTALRAARKLKCMLYRGFTTVRDACGADFGLAAAVDEGLIDAPRLYFVGKALSATGGHGDFRARGDDADACGCADGDSASSWMAKPPAGARPATSCARARTPSRSWRPAASHRRRTRLPRCIFRSRNQGHCGGGLLSGRVRDGARYTAEAIRRCLEFGVRSIEHGNLIDRPAAELAAQKGAFVVPTLVTYAAMHERGAAIGLPQYSIDKLRDVRKAGLESLGHLKAAGTRIGFGTDLFGTLHSEQSREFLIRAQAEPHIDVLRSATSVNAQLLGMAGKLGCIRPGAFADMLVLDGNPLVDLQVLQDQGRHIRHILRGGQFVKRSS